MAPPLAQHDSDPGTPSVHCASRPVAHPRALRALPRHRWGPALALALAVAFAVAVAPGAAAQGCGVGINYGVNIFSQSLNVSYSIKSILAAGYKSIKIFGVDTSAPNALKGTSAAIHYSARHCEECMAVTYRVGHRVGVHLWLCRREGERKDAQHFDFSCWCTPALSAPAGTSTELVLGVWPFNITTTWAANQSAANDWVKANIVPWSGKVNITTIAVCTLISRR